MGQMADDITDGTTCSICGCYFENPDDKTKAYTHGFPVACKKCFRSGMKREGIQKATAKTL